MAIEHAPPSLPRRGHAPMARLALVLAALLLASCSGSDGAATGKTRGLPEANLTDLRTGDAAGWDQDGTPMVVNLWASWCAPCRKEMPAFDQVATDLEGQVAFVGVTDDLNRDAAVEAAEASGVSYPLRYDEDATVMTDLDISGLPATVFVDADGTVDGVHLGALTEAELRAQIEERYDIDA